jgi:uncharacterized glyoxalase superfamily protein PhnB
MRSNRSVPKAIVIPELAYRDVGEAAAWLCDAFGFTVRLMIGNHRAQLNVGEGAVVVMEFRGEARSASAADHAVMVRVENIDAHCDRAREKGARILREPATYPYGERQYSAEDLGGHRWDFTETVADVSPEDWGGTSRNL